MRIATIAVLLVCLLVCLVIAALSIAGWGTSRGTSRGGGQPRGRADPAKSPHVVVDTLNLAHWLRRDKGAVLSTKEIIDAIGSTAPSLKIKHPGRVMYVLKDRETQFNSDASRELLRKAAEDNGVYVSLAEKYPDPPSSARRAAEHSSRARDDFLMAVLAARWRCAVLTDDRLRDFDRFRDAVSPFHVYEYAYWRRLPARDFIRPESSTFARLKKPKRLRYEDYFTRGS